MVPFMKFHLRESNQTKYRKTKLLERFENYINCESNFFKYNLFKFEIGEVVDVCFKHYRKPYFLKCEILELMETNLDESEHEIANQTQSRTQIVNEVSLRSRMSKKRERPISFVNTSDMPNTSKKLNQDVSNELPSYQLRPTSSKKKKQ